MLELINKFYKVVGYKIQLYFYSLNKLAEKEIRNTIPFIIAPKRLKYLGINSRGKKLV